MDPRGLVTVVLNKSVGLGLVLADNDQPDASPPIYETAVAGFAPVDGRPGPAELSGSRIAKTEVHSASEVSRARR